MLNILVAEGAAVATDSKSNIVSTRFIPCTRICRPQRLHGVSAFYTDGHLERSWFERFIKPSLLNEICCWRSLANIMARDTELDEY